jgi:hypothetical protein
MPSISIPAASACISILVLAGTLAGQTADPTAQTSEVSKVRIVRLSEVKGAVQLDRDTGHGYEPALPNLPIVEHSRLQTGAGVAEVEFEDNSTLRIAPGSIVEFPQLDRLPAGGTSSSVRLLKGTAYVSLLKTKGNQFSLLFGPQTIQLPPASHIRVQTDGTQATVAVLDGTVHIDGLAGLTDISKNKTATFQLQDQSQPNIAKDIPAEAFDAWDRNAAESHAQAATQAAFGSPYTYGIGDMMYYGAFTSMAGCGSIWRPYFAGAAWDPYSNGAWAWYQGAGYSWVSPYPWGWTAYHFGSWAYCPGAGWGWQPGGSWNGLNNFAAVVPGAVVVPGNGPGRLPPRPVRPPGAGEPTLTAVNTKPLVRSEVSANSFVFRADSAGLGIPRDGLGRLDKFSEGAISHGTATAPIYFEGRQSVSGNGRSGGGNTATGAIHLGSPPPREAQTAQQSGGWRSEGGDPTTRSAPEPASRPMNSSPPPGPSPSAPHSSQPTPSASSSPGRSR